MPLLLLFAFLSGLVTILAPCIWPLLPIILSSSITAQKGHWRALGITLGIMLSFGFFTLAISYLVRLFHFDPNALRIVAVIILGFLGLTMIIPKLQAVTEVFVSRLTGFFGQTSNTNKDFGSGFIAGLSLGIVWSPCAGPILAAIATLAATGQVNLTVILITVAYVTGVGIPLFIFSLAGQQLITRSKVISKYTVRIQQVFGIFMIVVAFAIYTNYDKYVQLQLLNAFPQLNSSLSSFENNPAITKQLQILKGQQPQAVSLDTSGLFNQNTPAPDFVGITKWLNTDKSLSIANLKGKVVLVDFWTYTCINCIRTLPHVTSWYNKYKDDGFVVIGVHTPEFAFEHDTANVENAIKMFHILYPVAQDNNYATWNNYNNQYWPAEYLIDANGNIRRTEFGEGEYDQTEMAIQQLLKEAGKHVTASLSSMPDQTPTGQISPETYIGAKRMQYYYPNGSIQTGMQALSGNSNIPVNSFSLSGSWNILDEYSLAGESADLYYNFYADKVFLVLRPAQSGVATVKVFLDGKVISPDMAGSDVKNGIITVDTDRLYNLVDMHGKIENHLLKLEFSNGIQVFAFTFG